MRGAGDVLAAGADAAASNRSAQLDAAMTQEQLNQQRQRNHREAQHARAQDQRASGSDAWRKMQQAEYLKNAKTATATERIAAEEFAKEAMKRIQAGDSLLPAVTDP